MPQTCACPCSPFCAESGRGGLDSSALAPRPFPLIFKALSSVLPVASVQVTNAGVSQALGGSGPPEGRILILFPECCRSKANSWEIRNLTRKVSESSCNPFSKTVVPSRPPTSSHPAHRAQAGPAPTLTVSVQHQKGSLTFLFVTNIPAYQSALEDVLSPSALNTHTKKRSNKKKQQRTIQKKL